MSKVSYATSWLAFDQLRAMRAQINAQLDECKLVPHESRSAVIQEYIRQLEILLAQSDVMETECKRLRVKRKMPWDSLRIWLWKWATRDREWNSSV